MSSDPEPRLIYAPDLTPQPWRNGGGQTRELMLWPSDPEAWRVRVSLARIDRSGPFSAFPGVERWFTVIEGAGVILSIDSQVLKLDGSSAPFFFDGGNPPNCSLIDGPTDDLNLMCRGGRGSLEAMHVGRDWDSPALHRGLFSRVSGVWHDTSGRRIELQANTLLWSASSTGPMIFDARSSTKTPVGYWLSYQPDSA
ncbi:MAG: HutD family protein [Steroidobacteraceae bacterium]|jgi:environmental stress-induced protein Ves